jgi:uncharacterized repeat protein (TIGR03803 family)
MLTEDRQRVFGRQVCGLAIVVAIISLQIGQAQTLSVLHSFTGGIDGRNPEGGVILDRAGNLYGTTSMQGMSFFGTAFRVAPRGSGWIFTSLYSFQWGLDGANPDGPLTFGPDGQLYGTTLHGGMANQGTVFSLRPPAHIVANILGGWSDAVLYAFLGGNDGASPVNEALAFDVAGNIYGTTSAGGVHGKGTVFKLTRTQGMWIEDILYSFTGGADGFGPQGGVVFDSAGNLYGTTAIGGQGFGVVYELSPSGPGWVETVLYTFTGGNDGRYPEGELLFDEAGNLYGGTYGNTGVGTVFRLSPNGSGWSFSLVHSFNGPGPTGTIAMDSSGSLFGATYYNAFRLTPSGGGWTYTDLHDFTGGEMPSGKVVLDASGNLYGTTYLGGAHDLGAVYRIAPD